MNRIGFNNFRRFEKFEELEYSGITFLVGRNNSGKSTLVKALLLIDNYLKSGNIDSFSFGNNVLEDANIVTYGRAKYNKSEENKVELSLRFSDFIILLTLTGDDDKSSAIISQVIILDTKYEFVFVFDMLNKKSRIIYENDTKPASNTKILTNDLEQRINELKQLINDQNESRKSMPFKPKDSSSNNDFKKTTREYIELIAEKEKLENRVEELKQTYFKTQKRDYILETDFGFNTTLSEIIDENIKHHEAEYQKVFIKIQNGEEEPEIFEDLKAFKDYGFYNIPNGIFDIMIEELQSSKYVYLAANPVKQSALFAIRDKSNALAQAIHEFKQLNILDGEEEHRFILKWMNAFDVGEDFEINMFSGEAYEMRINPLSDNIHLADKGMGSIQAMALIMKIACAIKKHNITKRERDDWNYKTFTTIIIEEPEITLHPALQSLLADLFLDVNQKYGIDFIIETHSEYIIRRSQVLVAEKEFEVAPNVNPFCVHYFPKEIEHPHYQLNYQPDGTFDKNFETGFFDTASLDTLKLLRIKREKMV